MDISDKDSLQNKSSYHEVDMVLFLGAGFSRDAGLPTMSEFGKGSLKDYNELLKHATAKRESKGFRNAAPLLVESADVFGQFQRFCKQSPTLRNTDVENIETVFCIAEAMYESDFKNVTLDNQEYTIDEAIRHIKLWLWKVYQQHPPMNRRRQNEVYPDSYKRFYSVLKESGFLNRLAVITTNYDLVFEHLFWINGIKCYYPLEGSESISIGGGTEPFVYLNNQDISVNECPIICKLHGSVNYFQDTLNPKNLYVANLCGGSKAIGKSGGRYWENKPAIFAVDAIWCIRNKYGNSFTPAVIPPTYAKLTQQTWLRNIWHTSLNILSNAKKIVFIGYSMPDSDGFMRALLHSALAIRASRPNVVPPQVFVIDPSEETHQRYKQVFHEIYRKINPLPFSEATKSIIPEILSKNNF